ncbi:chromosome condensation protein CrcB [Ectothiorhodospira shaposhnikovii]|uniref:fluoride efflux transporter FluC n=1 Tax=Ectothiorhodospira shaposhnikovii TaxID=1054 RepID=UPI001902F85E|nr:CrcB family protein [Ectothiorhodospira shaposhnikovii]MBK1673920.1 chromosome condensation protein CrcB [Ectothiorhodospira shaposhnikovii]
MRDRYRIWLAVALGSGLGAVSRHLVAVAAFSVLGPTFAWGTLAVNLVGSWLIGIYAALTEPGGALVVGPAMRQFVLAGFCGGFTTFSVFSLEALIWLQQGRPGLAGAYVIGSVILWITAVWTGYAQGMWINDRQTRSG